MTRMGRTHLTVGPCASRRVRPIRIIRAIRG